jgi:hypothetical protein
MDLLTLSASPQRLLPELLLESLRRMAAAGHQPGSYVVLRLTDGRIRAYALTDEYASPSEMIGQIRNEYGPLSSAFLVGSKNSQGGVQIFVEDLLGRRRLEQCAGSVAGRTRWNEMTNQAPAPPSGPPDALGVSRARCSRPFTMIAAG